MNAIQHSPNLAVRTGVALASCASVALLMTGCGSSSPSGSNAQTGGGSVPLTGNFCDKTKEIIANISKMASSAISSASSAGPNTDAVKQLIQQEQSEFPSWASSAPSELKDDANTLMAAEQKFFDAIKAANYDFTKVDPSAMQALDDSKTSAANSAIESYLTNTCHINLGTPDASPS